jgi:hypothetical protein
MQHIPTAIVYLGIFPPAIDDSNQNVEIRRELIRFMRIRPPDSVPHRFHTPPSQSIAAGRLTRAEADFGIATPAVTLLR